MNWTHYRTLVDYLTRLREDAPEQFDYGHDGNGHGSCGCVAHHLHFLDVDRTKRVNGPTAIRDYLDVSTDEACYLYGGDGMSVEGRCGDFYYTNPQRLGASGIAEALRRLAVVAARYGGEPASTPEPKPFVADDAAFLASVRALIGQPLVEAE